MQPEPCMVLQYVPIDRWLTWLARGWGIADDLQDTHHGQWSILMELVDD